MITKDGIAKLADFGIAKAVSSSTMVANETSRIIGSVHYFSPEQARGAYVDERSDIYSLGIVMYEMLTGQVPFDGDNPIQVALMHINDDILPPSHLVSGIPPALEKLVMTATDKYQTNRYKNAEEVLEELKNIEFVTKMVGDSVFIAADHHGNHHAHNGHGGHGIHGSHSTHGSHSQEMPKETETQYEAQDDVIEKPAKGKKEPTKNGKLTKGAKPRKAAIIGIIAVVALVIAVIGGLFAAGAFSGGKAIPKVIGMTPEEAKALIEEAGYQMEIGEEVRTTDVEKGQIAVQSPEEGEKAEKGSVVTVMVCVGKPTGVVPNVVGQMYDETIAPYLESQGYTLGNVEHKESDAEKGEIIRQDPGNGAEAEQGTKINIVVSKGTDKVKMPGLLGLTLDEAKQTLQDHGFEPGKVSYEESTVYAKNIVMDQGYSEGEKVKKGTKVDIVVSKGEPETTPEPEVPIELPEVDTEDQPDDETTDETQGEENNQSENGDDPSGEGETQPEEEPVEE